jgi:hypothetical protein
MWQPGASLRMLGWSCEHDCRYRCMWQATDARTAAGGRTLQYHGKWPFVRVFGVQEPVSAFFSAVNGLGLGLGSGLGLGLRLGLGLGLGLALGLDSGLDPNPNPHQVNGAAHAAGLRRCWPLTARVAGARSWLWRGLGLAAVQAWFWALVFHCRDVYWTQCADYFRWLGLGLGLG